MKKKSYHGYCLRSVLTVLALVSLTLSLVAPVSCRLTEEGIEILPLDTVAPKVESFSVTASNSIRLACSEKIVLDNIHITDCDGEFFAYADAVTYSEDECCAEIELSAMTTVGREYTFSAHVYDRTGNSLEFSQLFTGFNENPALLAINEVRVNGDSSKQLGEFVEFIVLKSGNTAGLSFMSTMYQTEARYDFPAMEVSKGDFITLHGRTFFTKSTTKEVTLISDWADERGDDLTLSKTIDSFDEARDLWMDGDGKLASKSSVLILRNSSSGQIIDALPLSEKGEKWPKSAMEKLIAEAFDAGVWTDGSSADCAFITSPAGSSANNSISRQNTEILLNGQGISSQGGGIASSAEDWAVIKSQGSGKNTVPGTTPGEMNKVS